MVREYPLDHVRWNTILSVLSRVESSTIPRRIAQEEGFSESHVWFLLRALEGRGLIHVIRPPGKRDSIRTLTPPGMELLAALRLYKRLIE